MAEKKRTFTLISILVLLLIIGGGFFYILPRIKKEKAPLVETGPEVSDDIDEKANILKLAEYYMDKEEYDLARAQLEQVLIRDPENKRALSLLEKAISKKKEITKKEEAREDKKLDEVVSTLKESVTEKRETVYQKEVNIEDEIEERIRESNKYFERGKKDYSKADYVNAIKNFEKSLELNPANENAVKNLSQI